MTPNDPPRFRNLAAADGVVAAELLAGASPAPRRAPSAAAVGAAWNTPEAGFVAVDGSGLAALATVHLGPSIYTGDDWAHIEDFVVRGGDEEPLTGALLRHTLRALTARGFPQASIGMPTGQEWLAGEARAAGLVEELQYMGRDRLDEVSAVVPPGLAVRAAHDGDAARLSDLVGVFAREFGYPSAAHPATVTDYLGRHNTGCLIAEYGDEAAGFVATSTPFSLHYGGLSLMIDDLVVLPELRRRGIAAALVERALECASERGCTVARLWMQPEAPAARGFYAALGFTDFGQVLMLPTADGH